MLVEALVEALFSLRSGCGMEVRARRSIPVIGSMWHGVILVSGGWAGGDVEDPPALGGTTLYVYGVNMMDTGALACRFGYEGESAAIVAATWISSYVVACTTPTSLGMLATDPPSASGSPSAL